MVTLDPEETLHLARVLRLGVGAQVEVCDGEGGNFAAQVATLEPRGATLRILGKLDAWGESPLTLVLGIGLAKGEAMDEAVRQATEMGVTRIFSFISERSERLSPERLERRRGRWQRLARESIKSCQRSRLPDIEPHRDFAGALEGPEAVKLIFWEEERGGGLKSFLAPPPAPGRQGPHRAGRRVFSRRGGPGPGGRLPRGQPGTPPPQGGHRGAGGHHPDPVRLGGPGLMAADLPYRDLNSYLKEQVRPAGPENHPGCRADLPQPGRPGVHRGVPLLQCPGLRDRRLGPGSEHPGAAGGGDGPPGPALRGGPVHRLFPELFQYLCARGAGSGRSTRRPWRLPRWWACAIGTRPDCLGDDVLDLLAGYARDRLVWLELGLQSAHDATLARLNRGHDAACFTDAATRAAARGLTVVAHVILGLPGEGPREMAATARVIWPGCPVHGVKIHLLYVIKDSGLARLHEQGEYACLSEDQYVNGVVDFIERLPPHLVIHRLTGDPHAERAGGPGLVSG